ncbi:MAG: BON domain-containing protein [Planctomycetales bacterium]|nr:BON domain-containing protein [Planctomycetales bacterium]
MRCRQPFQMIASIGLIVGCVVVFGASSAFGQISSGSRSVGTTISGGNRSAFGGTSVGGSDSLLSSLGSTSTSSGGDRITRTAGSFIGADSADAGFVGASAVTTSGARGGTSSRFGGLSGGLNGGFGGMSGLGGLGGFGSNSRGGMFGGANSRNRMNNMGMNRNNRQVNVRTQLDVGFRYQARPADRTTTTLVKMLNSKRIARNGDLQVEVANGTAILTGRVATRADRDLAVRIAKQEPGIQTVRDQLVVESPDEDALSPSDGQ